MTRYAFRLEYIGKEYFGSQKQPKRVTIQSEVEKALCTLIKTKIRTIFSGRTDKGVNAKGQIVHFDYDKPIVASRFCNSMNGLLPKDISVSDLKVVDDDFHAQKSARKRTYKYVFYNREFRSAFDGDLLLVKYDLNIERMNESLSYLEGLHNFSAFRASNTTVLNDDCFIYKAECQKLGDTVEITICGSRFLYNMVRTIVGTLLDIERHNLSSSKMKEILESRDRTQAGQTVNPYGLTLMKVEY